MTAAAAAPMKLWALKPAAAVLAVCWAGAPLAVPLASPPAAPPEVPSVPEFAPPPAEGEVGVFPDAPPEPAAWPGERFSVA